MSESTRAGPRPAAPGAAAEDATIRPFQVSAYPNLAYFNEVDRGGHFAAWEQPQLFSEELRAAFRSLRHGVVSLLA